MSRIAVSIAPKVAALMMNTQPLPTASSSRLPTAGPMRRAMLNDAEFRATAFDACSRLTISVTIACRAGLSIAFAMPTPRAMTSMIGRVIRPVSSSVPISTDSSARAVCVTSSSFCRSKRSAIQPETPASTSGGPNWQAIVNPTAVASWFVSSVSTTQSCAVDCIQVPTFDTSAPANHMR